MIPEDSTALPRREIGLEAELMPKLRRICGVHLGQILQRVYRLTDEAQFKLSQNDEVQFGSRNLEALRLLRSSINPLEQAFLKHFDSKFEVLQRRRDDDGELPADLALVDIEDMEDIVASELIAESVLRAFEPGLVAFERRFARLLGLVKLVPSHNPVSATNIANAMRIALQGLLLGPNVRILLFKHYERELASQLGAMFDEANALLANAGVLPELGRAKPVQRPRPAPQRVEPVPSAHDSPFEQVARRDTAPEADYAQDSEASRSFEADKALFESIRSLLAGWRPEQTAPGSGSTGQTAQPIATPGGPPAAHQRPLAMSELVSVLSMMQPNIPDAVTQAINRPESSLALLLKQEMLDSVGRLGMDKSQVRMNRDDEDAVDLVGMLFDVLFDERDFQAQGRTVISRMVVPYVKAAVMDRRLFQYRTHPARRLLNSVAEAVEGNKGEAVQERELLQKAEHTVDRLLAEFNEDLAIFETLEQELRAFLEQHRRRAELAERRASEAQSGQERLEQARALSASVLAVRLQKNALPEAIVDFLARNWAHHVSMVALREGEDSPAWQNALATADTLISLVPHEGHRPPSVAETLVSLRPALDGVLASSGIFGESADELVKSLALHLELAQREPPVPVKPDVAVQPERRRSVHAAAGDHAPLLSMVSDKDRLDYDDGDVTTIRSLVMGTWIDLAGEDGKLQPAKLTWVSPISSRLMFVNRRGVRMLVASIEELAAMKKVGKLTLRNQEQAFDLAMHRVMSRLSQPATLAT